MSREVMVVAAAVVRWEKRCGIYAEDIGALEAVEAVLVKRLKCVW